MYSAYKQMQSAEAKRQSEVNARNYAAELVAAQQELSRLRIEIANAAVREQGLREGITHRDNMLRQAPNAAAMNAARGSGQRSDSSDPEAA